MSFRRWTLLSVAVLVLAIVAGAVGVQVRHWLRFRHFARLGLHADAVSERASIGIPGQTHLYWAELTNFGWPTKFLACDYVTDATTPGTEYAYAVQRWDNGVGRWVTVAVPDVDWFCRPVPLSKVGTETRPRVIWPGQTFRVMEFEAVGARDEFKRGDWARFVVLRGPASPVDERTGVPSDGFLIEDNVVAGAGSFRIRH